MHGYLNDAERDIEDFNISLALREPPTADLLADLRHRGLDGIWVPGWAAAGADSPVEAKIEASARFAEEVMRPLAATS
jgi:hypothetical protein